MSHGVEEVGTGDKLGSTRCCLSSGGGRALSRPRLGKRPPRRSILTQ